MELIPSKTVDIPYCIISFLYLLKYVTNNPYVFSLYTDLKNELDVTIHHALRKSCIKKQRSKSLIVALMAVE